MQTSRPRGLERWSVLGLLLLAFAIRVLTLTNQSLWRDEVDALRFATAPWAELLRTFSLPGWNGPLYFALLRGWIALSGHTELAMRYSSLMWGVLAIPLAHVLARRLASPHVALGCAGLFALSPYFIWYSQEVKMYTLVLALATLAIYALRRALHGSAAWWIAVVASTSIAIYCHILAALLIPVEMILTLIWGLGSRGAAWWKGALASFACLTLPYVPLLRWQIPLALTPAQTGFTYYPLDRMLLVMLTGFSIGVGGRLPEMALWPSGLLLVAAVVAGVARVRDRVALLVWLLAPPLAIWLVSLNRPIFTDRYLIWVGPAFYLLLAIGAAALGQFWRPLGVAAVIAVTGVAVAGIYSQTTTPIKSDFRSAARYYQSHRSPGDLIVFQIPYVRYTFNYYYTQPYEWVDGLYTNYGMSDAEVDTQMRALLAGHKTVWLVASEMTMWDSQLQVWKWLESHARRTDLADFAQVTLYRYEF
jgi:mannosyltransferase